MLPPELAEYKDVFEFPKGLPNLRGKWDFKLHPIKNYEENLKYQEPITTDDQARKAIHEMLCQYLKDGWISASDTTYAVGMFPVPKKDGTYRYIYNYPMINNVCKINKFPIPNLRDKVNTVAQHQYIIAFDLRSAYNQIRITDRRNQDLTTFSTEFGNFKWHVMPFGLSDAPPFFQSFINTLLMEKLDNGVLAYLDDVLVYGNTREECLNNAKWVLNKFRENQLFCKITKCEFFPSTVEYLGYAIKMLAIFLLMLVNWNHWN